MTNYYNKDLYKILEIDQYANEENIKSAYRKLVIKYHPDINKNNKEAEKKFKEITEAYEILTNPQKKKIYDALKGFSTEKNEQKNNDSIILNAQNSYKKEKSPKKNKDEKIFSNVLDDMIGNFFDNKKNKPIKGKDIKTPIKIKQQEAITGTNRTINVLHTEKCPKCNGRKILNETKCPLCNGKGEISNHKKINVKIPQGIKNNHQIKIKGEGDLGQYGGKNGDLYLTVEIELAKFFKPSGENIQCELPISITEAVLGADIEVPTIHGNVIMKIPPMTSSGQKFRLTNQGIINPKTKKQGDQIVTVIIKLPKSFSDKEYKHIEELKKIENYNIRENILNE